MHEGPGGDTWKKNELLMTKDQSLIARTCSKSKAMLMVLSPNLSRKKPDSSSIYPRKRKIAIVQQGRKLIVGRYGNQSTLVKRDTLTVMSYS
jgi:hypothetical protein